LIAAEWREAEMTQTHTQIVEQADDWTRKHLIDWLSGEFSEEAIEENRMVERMLSTYNDDPEFYGMQSWWVVLDASKISRMAGRL
jgi:hypothetical protein